MVFIRIESRRIWLSPCTANPTGDWTTQQARNFQMHLVEENLPCTILMRDNDRKYVDDFDKVFTASKCAIKRNVIASPNLQAFVERVIQTLKHEVLNAFCILNEAHLNYILRGARLVQSIFRLRVCSRGRKSQGFAAANLVPRAFDRIVSWLDRTRRELVQYPSRCDSIPRGHQAADGRLISFPLLQRAAVFWH